jgi:GNAT superfamily N-acetyltransferase
MPFDVKNCLTERQVRDLVQMYQNEWWTRGRQEVDVRQMLKHTDLVVAISAVDGGQLVAFARVLTDFVYKAIVFDVIVAPTCRSQGIGRLLLGQIVNHPALLSVKHLELYCLPAVVPFYERWGFSTDLGELRLMRLARE